MDFDNLVQVDIATGEVTANHLNTFWQAQARSSELSETTPDRQHLTGTNTETLIAQRVKVFNLTSRKRRYKNAWTEHELYRLAVLIVLRKQKFHQAAARLAKTTAACRKVFKKMKKAGVV
ncbi:hypothetical protein SPSYN_01081 [Sporotomaculum syntrophicum]|uniref:Uncharacterized protein n=1 Tax=Sporotomaculum syntrophicum TaxID=182264 RepID=A0A9D2WP13_9FIRM|nr:hypothetical protein [Sporotomaculum syntrophicum]KAF1084945.1 hypothetical protein SPSYN_01081 [Sporotomaculum syntrophicum]